MPNNILFEPFDIKGLHLKNRIVMAPMTRAMSPNGIITSESAEYYRRRAAADVGLIVTEATGIERPISSYDAATPHFWGQDALNAWQHVANVVHDAGGAIAPQLWHIGAQRHPFTNEQMPGLIDSPSGIFQPNDPDDPTEPPMTLEAIADTVAAYAKAAGECRRLGFDALELHGAHGYIIDQFFWEKTNLRTDIYGGKDIADRVRFAVDVVRAVREAVGPDFPLLIRVSQWKSQDYGAKIAHSPQEMERWLAPLAEAGVDCFHCSQRRIWEPEFAGSDLNLAGWAKKITGKPTIAVGSVGLTGEFMEGFAEGVRSQPASLDGVINQMERGDYDMVAIGRALLQDPEWASKIRHGRVDELRDYTAEALATLY